MPNAPSQPSASQTSNGVSLPGEKLSLNEMLRVMDVAREIGRDRATAERMFQQTDIRVQLREKLLRSAEVSGDRVTAAEIDAAIDQYFQDLHTYRDPATSWATLWAYAWIWRRRIAAAMAVIVFAIGSLWLLFFSPVAPLNSEVQARRNLATQNARAAELMTQIQAIADDAQAVQRADSLQAQVSTASTADTRSATTAIEQLEQLQAQLAAEYHVRIVSGGNAASMLEREGLNEQTRRYRSAGYYVIVEAIDVSGKVLPQQIRNAETGKVETVNRWAERVPEEVYQRLATDKRSDGVLNETVFSKKSRGQLEPKVELTDDAGNPIQLTAQLTQLDVPQ